MISAAILMLLPLCITLAAFTDLVKMTIPNRIPALLLISFVLLAPFSALGWSEIGTGLLAGGVVFCVGFALFALNVMGGGDAKLLTACAVWYGFNHSLLVFLMTVGYVGGAVTLVILLLRSQANSVMAMGIPLPASLVTAKKIPYGIAIAIAGFLTFHQAPIYSSAIKALY
jgi:prepilin peptidase CpaA